MPVRRIEKLERGEAWSTEQGTPYGLRYVKPKNKHTPACDCYVIVPEAANTVRRAIELVASGMSAQKVAQLFTQERIVTPHGGTTWRPSTIRQWVHNTAYHGELPRNRYEVIQELHTAAVEQMAPIRDIKEACDLVWTWMGQDPPFAVKQKVVRALLTRVVAWLEEGDEQGNGRKSPKRLHFHMEGRLPSLLSEEGEVPEFIDAALRCQCSPGVRSGISSHGGSLSLRPGPCPWPS